MHGLAATENRSPTLSSSNYLSGDKTRKRLKGDGFSKTDGSDETIKPPELKLQIPHSLKLQLVDDWEYITRQQRVS